MDPNAEPRRRASLSLPLQMLAGLVGGIALAYPWPDLATKLYSPSALHSSWRSPHGRHPAGLLGSDDRHLSHGHEPAAARAKVAFVAFAWTTSPPSCWRCWRSGSTASSIPVSGSVSCRPARSRRTSPSRSTGSSSCSTSSRPTWWRRWRRRRSCRPWSSRSCSASPWRRSARPGKPEIVSLLEAVLCGDVQDHPLGHRHRADRDLRPDGLAVRHPGRRRRVRPGQDDRHHVPQPRHRGGAVLRDDRPDGRTALRHACCARWASRSCSVSPRAPPK